MRAFADSNGDGIGDFPGLLSRLDYLQDLGDHLHLASAVLSLAAARRRLRYFELRRRESVVRNAGRFQGVSGRGAPAQYAGDDRAGHQSHQRSAPLVQGGAAGAARVAAARDVCLVDTDQQYKDARIIFTDTEKSNWTWDETAKAYYWHRFFSHQPDLNFDNPLVLEEVLKAMRFWLDMGVDALRMDAIPYLVRARRDLLRKPAGDARGHQEAFARRSMRNMPTA